MRMLLVVCAVSAAACAARAPRPLPFDVARFEALIAQGCYDCFLEAREMAAASAEPASLAALRRQFEVELLLAIREKELAIDPASTLARVDRLASQIGSASQTGTGTAATRLAAIVSELPADSAGTPRLGRTPPLIVPGPGAREAYLRDMFSATANAVLSPAGAAYTQLAVRCAIAPDTVSEPLLETVPAAPLLQYKRATCAGRVDAPRLEAVRKAEPRFVETSLFRGRAAMAEFARTDGSQARAFVEEAHARFPNSPAVTLQLATIAQGTGDCRRAEEYYDETLALSPRHEDARLGRAICRTYQKNPDGAIADATVLVDASTDNRAEAFYWRAWNHRSQKRLDEARADINRARALLYNARVLTLAGMIEHDQQEFDRARDDLTRARDMDSRECQARWYLGLVGYGTEQWDASARGFADAAECYARLIRDTEAQRDALLRREDLSAEYRARQLAGFNAAIAEDSTQKSAADLNAAINFGRAQDMASATTYMKRAWEDPERRSAVEDLRQILGVPRW
jgi:tetratricopeptide (TPR) repeat protein